MCEYCGCQALDSIALLTREHEAALDLVYSASEALRGGRLAETRQLCAELRAVLAPHTAVEEHALFPVMAVEFPEQIGALVADHEVIDAALAEAVADEPAAAWESRLATALTLLPQHILREQDGVFPAALTTLSPDQWDLLDTVRAAHERSHRASV